MTEITSLADQIRNRVAQPAGLPEPPVLKLLRDYDNADHQTLVHVRFNEKTVRTLNQLKLATGLEITRVVAYSVSVLLEQHPELKTIIKEFLQNL